MVSIKYYIGIDISMKKFDVCLSLINTIQQVKVKATKSFQNNTKGFESFLIWTKKLGKKGFNDEVVKRMQLDAENLLLQFKGRDEGDGGCNS